MYPTYIEYIQKGQDCCLHKQVEKPFENVKIKNPVIVKWYFSFTLILTLLVAREPIPVAVVANEKSRLLQESDASR